MSKIPENWIHGLVQQAREIKPGTFATIKFAGSVVECELISIDMKDNGIVKRKVFKFKGPDGTIYPISNTDNILNLKPKRKGV